VLPCLHFTGGDLKRQGSCLHAECKAAACAEVYLHGQDGELRQYVLKREFAEGAIYMTMPQFPAEALLVAQNGPETLYRFGQLLFRDDNTLQA
jgi:hypothetical protein